MTMIILSVYTLSILFGVMYRAFSGESVTMLDVVVSH